MGVDFRLIKEAVRELVDSVVSSTISRGDQAAELPRYDGEEQYANLRAEGRELLKKWNDAPDDPELGFQFEALIIRLQNLDLRSLSPNSGQRSKVNQAVLASTCLRTHYSAYLAGRLSAGDFVDGPYLAWLHNAAAHGAINMFEHLDLASKLPGIDADFQNMSNLLAQGSAMDANRFLDLAREAYPNCVITAYNRSKLEILIGKKTARRAVKILEEIPAPTESSHEAELGWHENLLQSFEGDGNLRTAIEKLDPGANSRIRERLTRNAEVAEDLVAHRTPSVPASAPVPEEADRKRLLTTAIVAGITIVMMFLPQLAGAQASEDFLSKHNRVLTSVLHSAPKDKAESIFMLPDTPSNSLSAATGGMREFATGSLSLVEPEVILDLSSFYRSVSRSSGGATGGM